MLKLILARIEFTFFWSFLVWLCVIGPWSTVACISDAWSCVTHGMSTSQWFSGEPQETPRTLCSLRQSSLMTRLPHGPGSTKKPSMTSSCHSCHHAARTWPRWPQGLSYEPTCLLHTWRPHWQRPFALVLHLHQH
jgi:hypothetical protein